MTTAQRDEVSFSFGRKDGGDQIVLGLAEALRGFGINSEIDFHADGGNIVFTRSKLAVGTVFVIEPDDE